MKRPWIVSLVALSLLLAPAAGCDGGPGPDGGGDGAPDAGDAETDGPVCDEETCAQSCRADGFTRGDCDGELCLCSGDPGGPWRPVHGAEPLELSWDPGCLDREPAGLLEGLVEASGIALSRLGLTEDDLAGADYAPVLSDAALLPWDPEKLNNENVGIPVSYRLVNDEKSGLGQSALWGGKMRLFQADGSESTIFLGEDNTSLVPVGQKTDLTLGDSRDIVVTQRQMKNERTNIRRNNNGDIVLYDTNEQITAKIENFKDKPAVLTLIQHIEGQWNMTQCTVSGKEATYTKKDARTLVFEIQLPPRTADGPSVQELDMRFQRLNVPEGRAARLMR